MEVVPSGMPIAVERYGSLRFLRNLKARGAERMGQEKASIRGIIGESVLVDLQLAASARLYRPFRGGVHNGNQTWVSTGPQAIHEDFYPPELKQAVDAAQGRIFGYANVRYEKWKKVPWGEALFTLLQAPGVFRWSCAASVAGPILTTHFAGQLIDGMEYAGRTGSQALAALPSLLITGTVCLASVVGTAAAVATLVEGRALRMRIRNELGSILSRMDEFYPDGKRLEMPARGGAISHCEFLRRKLLRQNVELEKLIASEAKMVEDYYRLIFDMHEFAERKYGDTFSDRVAGLCEPETVIGILDRLDEEARWPDRERTHIERFICSRRDEFEGMNGRDASPGEFGGFVRRFSGL